MNVKEFCENYYVDRTGTASLKWDALDVRYGNPDLISMWVADMEFKTPECVREALKKRVEHGVYGYSFIPDSYYQAVINWEEKHHGYHLDKDWIRVTPGVVSALYWMVNMYTQKDDSVIIMTPVYYPFHNCVTDNNRTLVTYDMEYDKGIFTIDFDAFEKKIIDNNVKMYIMCSPHNPAGRVWKEEELEKMLEICQRHNVLVISDEIHQDLVFEGHKHIPVSSVSEDARNRTISMYAPSKTFNLAGLIGSYHIIYNKYLRSRVEKESSLSHYNDCNVLSMYALMGAYSDEGKEWHKQLVKVLNDNINYACDYIEKHFDGVTLSKPEGTYMLYLDTSEWSKKTGVDCTELLKRGNDCGIAWQDGRMFVWPDTIRINVALPTSRVIEAFDRMDKYVFNLK